MRIRWPNVVAAALIVALVICIARYGGRMWVPVERALNPRGMHPQDDVIALVALGLTAVAAVAIVRILVQRR